MALNKDYLRNKVIQGIKLMPSNAILIRGIENNYREVASYGKITDLIGLLYSNGNSSSGNTTSYQDKGNIDSKNTKTFLIDFNDSSKKMKKRDILIFENGQIYEITFIDENFEVYFQANIEIKEELKYENGYIVDGQGSLFEIMEVPKEFWK